MTAAIFSQPRKSNKSLMQTNAGSERATNMYASVIFFVCAYQLPVLASSMAMHIRIQVYCAFASRILSWEKQHKQKMCRQEFPFLHFSSTGMSNPVKNLLTQQSFLLDKVVIQESLLTINGTLLDK